MYIQHDNNFTSQHNDETKLTKTKIILFICISSLWRIQIANNWFNVESTNLTSIQHQINYFCYLGKDIQLNTSEDIPQRCNCVSIVNMFYISWESVWALGLAPCRKSDLSKWLVLVVSESKTAHMDLTTEGRIKTRTFFSHTHLCGLTNKKVIWMKRCVCLLYLYKAKTKLLSFEESFNYQK